MANHSFQLSAILLIRMVEKSHKIQWEKCILLFIRSYTYSEYFLCKLFKTIHKAWHILVQKVDTSQATTIEKYIF